MNEFSPKDLIGQEYVSLIAHGSNEIGLSREVALKILNELRSVSGAKVLGIEVWRLVGEIYNLDALDGWYAGCEPEINDFDSAQRFLLAKNELDTLTLQTYPPLPSIADMKD